MKKDFQFRFWQKDYCVLSIFESSIKIESKVLDT